MFLLGLLQARRAVASGRSLPGDQATEHEQKLLQRTTLYSAARLTLLRVEMLKESQKMLRKGIRELDREREKVLAALRKSGAAFDGCVTGWHDAA